MEAMLEAGPARRARSLASFGGIGSQSHNTIVAMFHDDDGNTVIKKGFKFKEEEEEREDIE